MDTSYGEYHKRIQNLYATGGLGLGLGNRLEKSRGATLMDIVRRGNQLTAYGKAHPERVISRGDARILGTRIVGIGEPVANSPPAPAAAAAAAPAAGVGASSSGVGASSSSSSGSQSPVLPYQLQLVATPPTDTQQSSRDTQPISPLVHNGSNRRASRSPSTAIEEEVFTVEGQDNDDEQPRVDEITDAEFTDGDDDTDTSTHDGGAADDSKKPTKEEKRRINQLKREARIKLEHKFVIYGIKKDVSTTKSATISVALNAIDTVTREFPELDIAGLRKYYRELMFTERSRDSDEPVFLRTDKINANIHRLLTRSTRSFPMTSSEAWRRIREGSPGAGPSGNRNSSSSSSGNARPATAAASRSTVPEDIDED